MTVTYNDVEMMVMVMYGYDHDDADDDEYLQEPVYLECSSVSKAS